MVRLNGKNFGEFTKDFEKPHDKRLSKLMNKCAKHIMMTYKEITLAYGCSDEFSFVFRKTTGIFDRDGDRILATLVSLFSSAFLFFFPKYFDKVRMIIIPSFAGKVNLYPGLGELKAYISSRQS